MADWPAAKSNKCDATKSEILKAPRITPAPVVGPDRGAFPRSHGCVVAEDRRAIGTHVDLAAEPAVRLLRSHTVLNLRLSQTVPRGSRGKQRGIGVTVGRPVGCGNKTTKKRAVTGSVRLRLRRTERVNFVQQSTAFRTIRSTAARTEAPFRLRIRARNQIFRLKTNEFQIASRTHAPLKCMLGHEASCRLASCAAAARAGAGGGRQSPGDRRLGRFGEVVLRDRSPEGHLRHGQLSA